MARQVDPAEHVDALRRQLRLAVIAKVHIVHQLRRRRVLRLVRREHVGRRW